ncbi:hypothetical protein NMY22_g18805 [Coprinellus aureogranulatus]|nr:hypothetical protein NMY22_g18805 [Coprinellus aureogranulatus]
MIEDLTADELRWLEASEIIDFPASPTDSFHVNGGVVLSQRSSRFTEDFHHSDPYLNAPRIIASKLISFCAGYSLFQEIDVDSIHSCSSEQSLSDVSPWFLPFGVALSAAQEPIASRLGPSTSALSSTMPLSQSAPVRDASHLLIRTPSITSAKTARGRADIVNDQSEETANSNGGRSSGGAPFWSSMLRPRSRSVRSIPALKPIPSQSQVDFQQSYTPPLPHHYRNDVMEDIPESIAIGRRSPSISSTSSSTLSSATSSSHPDTPVSVHPDPFGAFVNKPHKGCHRRHISAPTNSRDYRLAPLSTSPNKSILTRSSSISTKDSAITPSNKSVKFVEVPTVHYSSAGYWGDVDGTDRRTQPEAGVGIDHNMGMDVDSMDMGATPPPRVNGGAWNVNRLGFASSQWANTAEYDMDIDPPPRIPQEEKNSSFSLKRLMSLSRRSSVSTSASSSRRKSSASTSSTATITPGNFLPTNLGKSEQQQPPPTPPKPAISGPYALGSVQAVSPAHSTASLRSTSRHKPKAKSMSYVSTPSSGSSGAYDRIDTLEDCRSTKNAAARSVRSIASVKSDASASTTKRFKSFLLNKVSVGGAWSKH